MLVLVEAMGLELARRHLLGELGQQEEWARVEVAYPVVAPMAAVCEMVLAFWVC